ncbi:MAG TPA: UDP-3-O-acyl-N-acetylglucosamine deacetylase [bacterium]|nr:UDP-3-O-acyl-N-acetylglucosamine deacetylase [bacterium]
MGNELTLPRQKTISQAFTFEGVGLHTGKKCRVRVSPLPEDSGLRFFRSDLNAEIPITPEAVSSTQRGTALTGEKNAVIHTIEHFLATVLGFGLTNLKVEMDSEEMPIMDGSAAPFCEMLRKAGILEQKKSLEPLRITSPIELNFGDTLLKAEPAQGLHLEVTTSFPYPGLENQKKMFNLPGQSFEDELALARTFCFENEVEELRRQGLIKGGNLDCAIVLGKNGILNGPFRFEDEIVRHKTLDLLGDLALLNRPLWAKVTVKKAGHRYHVELAKAILKQAGNGSQKTKPGLKEGTMLDIIEIQKTLPHRYPFLLVDRILELEPNKRVVGIKNVSVNEPFFEGHFPGHPVMPGVLLIEAMAQVGGIALLKAVDGSEGKIMYLAGVDNARFRRPALPGDQIRFEVEILSNRGKAAKFSGKAYIDGKVAVEADIMCMMMSQNAGNNQD